MHLKGGSDIGDDTYDVGELDDSSEDETYLGKRAVNLIKRKVCVLVANP